MRCIISWRAALAAAIITSRLGGLPAPPQMVWRPMAIGSAALAGLGAEALDHLGRDALLGEALDLLHEAFFVQADEAHGRAFVARAAGAADAVHVVFAARWGFRS